MNTQDMPEDGVIPMAAAAGMAQNDTTAKLGNVELQDDAMLEDDFAEDDFTDEADDGPHDEKQAALMMKQKMEEIFALDPLEEEFSELDVLTLAEAAIYLKVEFGDVRRMIKEQDLPGRKIGDEWRFLRGALADWLRAPGGMPARMTPPAPPARAERPAFDDRPPREERPRRRFPEVEVNADEGYPPRSQPPRPRPQFRSQNQFGGGAEAGGQPGAYPPPRRGRYENEQQPPQGEYRPPRKRPPFRDNQGGGQQQPPGGNQFGGGQEARPGYAGGPRKPKREALGNQRFKRLDRRRFGNEQDGNQE